MRARSLCLAFAAAAAAAGTTGFGAGAMTCASIDEIECRASINACASYLDNLTSYRVLRREAKRSSSSHRVPHDSALCARPSRHLLQDTRKEGDTHLRDGLPVMQVAPGVVDD